MLLGRIAASRCTVHRACLALLAAALPSIINAAEGPWVETYVDAAEVAAVYGGPGDAISLASARQTLLGLVNSARQAAGAPILGPAPLANQLAQAHAEEMANMRYVGHTDLSGRKCEMRWNDLGQTDHVAENIAYYEINHTVHLTPQLVQRIHEHWLASESHQSNELNPAHTHLGSGFAVVTAEGHTYAAVVAEFVTDCGDYDRLPASAQTGQTLSLQGWLDPGRARLAFVGLGSEDRPFARDVEYQMSHISGYSQPDVALAFMPESTDVDRVPDVRYKHFTVAADAETGYFALDIELEPHWPAAAYYFTVWALGLEPEAELFCAMTQVVLVEQKQSTPSDPGQTSDANDGQDVRAR